MIDYMNRKCVLCHKGRYQETSIHDDWEGKLHCNKCGHEIKRHNEKRLKKVYGIFEPPYTPPESDRGL